MPSLTTLRRHTPALAGDFDATRFAGKSLFTAGSSSTTLASGISRFDDVIEFLNGYGSRSGQDLGSLITAAMTSVSGTMTAGINQDDFFFLSHDSAAFSITVDGNVGPQFGFTAGTHSSSVVGGANVVTATMPWQRGVFALHQNRFSVTVGSSSFTVPSSQRATARQSLPTWLYVRQGTSTLEDAMTAGSSAYVDAQGRVVIEQYTGRTFDPPSAWSADGRAFWVSVGGTGRETISTVGNRQILIAENRCPGFLAFDRQYVELRRFTTGRDDRVVMADGSIASAGLSPLQGWEMTLRAGGPALGFGASLENALRDFFKHSRSKITFFPMWGDLDESRGSIETRKHVDLQSAYASGSSAYTTTQTIEADIEASHFYKRKGGRLFLRRAVDDSQRRVEDYGGRQLDVFQDVRFKFLDDPTR